MCFSLEILLNRQIYAIAKYNLWNKKKQQPDTGYDNQCNLTVISYFVQYILGQNECAFLKYLLIFFYKQSMHDKYTNPVGLSGFFFCLFLHLSHYISHKPFSSTTEKAYWKPTDGCGCTDYHVLPQ